MFDFKSTVESGKKLLAPVIPFMDSYWKPLSIAVVVITIGLFLFN